MVSPEIASFAERVRRALSHLPVEQVADLTDGLEANVAASVADGTPLPDVEAYVAELLTAAGLEAPAQSDANKVKFTEVVAKLKSGVRGLAPMWWLLRAVAATFLIGVLTSTDPAWGAGRAMVRVGDNLLLGWVVFIATLVVSVWAGRLEKRIPAVARIVPGALVVALSLSAVGNEFDYAAMMKHPQRLACFELGFDSMGRRQFPTEPYPQLVGMSLYDADKAIMEWGGGLAMTHLMRGIEVVNSPRAVIVHAEPAYIDSSGVCPTINIPIEIAEEPPTTVLPETTTVPPTSVSATTTSSSTTVTPPSTVAGVVTTMAANG